MPCCVPRSTLPSELDTISRRVVLEIEEQALKHERIRPAVNAWKRCVKNWWKNGEKLIPCGPSMILRKSPSSGSLREQIEKTRREIEQAERSYNLEQASKLKYSELPGLETALKNEETALNHKQGGQKLLREEVTEDEIAEIVAHWTGIPVTRLVETERDKLLKLDEILHPAGGWPG